ncbi:MAG: hypothetical protein WBM44_10440 [Waterburya sp.]
MQLEGRSLLLLIDEIDKSDIDFPNDLLNVFEDEEFDIPETKGSFPFQNCSDSN